MKKLVKASAVVVTLYSSIIVATIVLPIPDFIKIGVIAFALVATSISLTSNN